MAYQSSMGTLSLFNNDHKKQENHPDRTGLGEFPKALLKELIAVAKETPGDTIPVQCAGWDRTSKAGKNYIYISFEKKWVKPEPVGVENNNGLNKGESGDELTFE